MLSNALSLAAVAVALFPTALALGPNLVTNPSFEVNGISSPATVNPPDAYTWAGWSNPVSNALVFTGTQLQNPDQFAYTADGGIYSVYFGSQQAPGDSFTQPGLATTVGLCYSVSFQASIDGITDNQLSTAFQFDTYAEDVTAQLQAPVIAATPAGGPGGVYQTIVRLLPATTAGGSTIGFTGYSFNGYSAVDAVQVALSATGIYNGATNTCSCPPGTTLSTTTLDCALTASAGGGVRARRSRSRRHNEVQW